MLIKISSSRLRASDMGRHEAQPSAAVHSKTGGSAAERWPTPVFSSRPGVGTRRIQTRTVFQSADPAGAAGEGAPSSTLNLAHRACLTNMRQGGVIAYCYPISRAGAQSKRTRKLCVMHERLGFVPANMLRSYTQES